MIDDFTTPGDGETWPQRGRGGWWRNEKGQALVTHPNGKRKLAYDGGSSLWPFDPYDGPAIYGQRGTHLHSICDLADRGEPLPADFIAEGEGLGIGADLQAYIYARYVVFLKAHGFDVTHIEVAAVNDAAKVATNIDRVLHRDGYHWVADIKSSGNVITPGYLLQLAACAGAVPYDLDTDERLEWDVPLVESHGYILWFPLTAAIRAERDTWPDWSLVSVALAPGRMMLRQLLELRDDKGHADAFTVLDREAEPTTPTLEALREEARQLGVDDPEFTRRLVAYFDANDTDRNDAGQVDEAIRAVVNFADVDVEPVTRPTTPPAATVAPKVVDEGATISDGDLAAAGARYGRLGDAERSWVSVCGGKVRLSPDHGGIASVRRFELLRALCTLAEGGFDDDDVARACLAPIVGDIVWQGAPVADAVASLEVDEARRFALLVDAVAGQLAPFAFPDDGRTVIVDDVLAKVAA